MDYGSVLGMGGYFGIDFTSFTIQLDEEYIAQYLGYKNVSENNVSSIPAIRLAMQPSYFSSSNTIVMSNAFGYAFEKSVLFYQNYLGNNSADYRLKPNYITNATQIRELTSYITWTALIALMGYTNGFPYTIGLLAPSTNVTYASWLMIVILLAVIMPLVAYVFLKLLSYWNDPRSPISLPAPSKTQKMSLYAVLIAALAAGVQGLLGAYTMHLYTSPTFYGINMLELLPFNVSRALHYTLAVLWIAVTWIAFSLFVLPYFGLKISRKQVVVILGLGVTVSSAILLGILMNYLQIIPYQSSAPMWWFMFGGKGRDVATQGTVWLLMISVLLFYLAYLFYKASKTAADPLKPFTKILSIAIGGTAFGTLIGALPVVQPWPNFTIDEYFRWIFIHAYVEGFWPAIVVTILVTLLIIAGLFPVRLGTAVVGMDATLEIITGMIGTAHHYYWGGQPPLWMYLGAAVSTLEAIPLGFAIVYAILLWKKGETKTEFQKTLVTFTLVAGIGGGIGAAVFGAGLINLPYLNYYLHDLQTTMAHAHLAFPLAYGLPSMLMWIVMMYLSGGFGERHLRWFRYSAIIIGVGFYLQAVVSLLVLGVLQFSYELKLGFWYTKTIVTPAGNPGFWQIPLVQNVIDLRMIGDLVAGAGMALIILAIIINFRRSMKD